MPFGDYALKDINKLGRPLSKTIIIDNIEESYAQTSPFNGIKVTTWLDDVNDKVLPILGEFLK